VLGAVAPVDQYYVHAAIDGLRAGRTYYYAVGHDGFDPADIARFGFVGSFTTAPSRREVSDPFTFTAFGDQGVSYQALADDGAVAAQDPRSTCSPATSATRTRPASGCRSAPTAGTAPTCMTRVRDSYLLQIEPIASRVPWMVATGNHDMEAL